jgi:ATP-dependent helicase/nuclease subunit A
MNLAQLISKIYEITHLDRIYEAMDGGSVRQANLQIFYQMAASFEGRGHRDLAQFLEHLSVMEDAGLAVSAQENTSDCVTLMSIHKSKGLEFPVVFLCGLSREFNRESLRAQVLCDQSLGLGLSAADPKNRVRYPTIAKRAIAARISADSISEELRVLYVAMTRPKDRLIMVYSAKTLEDDLKDIALRMNLSPKELLTGSVVCPGEWVLQTAINRTEAGSLHTYSDARPDQTVLSQHPWKITIQTGCPAVASETSIQEEVHTIPAHMIQHLQDALAFRYGHISATQTLAKMTATQIKGRMKDQEAAENAVSEPNYSKIRREVSFDGDVSSATLKGTAVHTVLQYIHFDACGDVSSIQSELQRMIQRDLITPEQAMLVDCEKIARFFASDFGKRLIQGKHILREFKFSILEDGTFVDDLLSGEQILLQGVVDCALVEDDGIVLLDFKTDQVSGDLLQSRVAQYRPQVETYARALARIYELPIKEKYLYFFHLDQFIRL